jgi:NitT/TauT family transport system ATP-binding protein
MASEHLTLCPVDNKLYNLFVSNNKVNDESKIIISASNLQKNYDSRLVIEPTNLNIHEGSFVSFIGPSGCGKSTLLRMLANIEKPTDGIIKWWGLDGKILGSPDRRLSMVFQDPTLMPWTTVLNNVCLPLQIEGVSKNEAHEAAMNALKMVQLEGKELLYPKQLSGGMQMRVSIARALVTKPNILLMDEPFGALDEMTRNQLNEDILKLKHELNMTIVFVTHSIQEAVFVSSEIFILKANPGKIKKIISLVKPDCFWNDGDNYRISEAYFNYVKKISIEFKNAYYDLDD